MLDMGFPTCESSGSKVQGSEVQGSEFRVLGSKVKDSAPPLTAKAANLIEKETLSEPKINSDMST